MYPYICGCTEDERRRSGEASGVDGRSREGEGEGSLLLISEFTSFFLFSFGIGFEVSREPTLILRGR